MNIQQVQTIIADAMEKHNGIVKKEELTRLGIDYRRIDKLVREGKLVRIRNGYYTDRVDDFSEDALVAATFSGCNALHGKCTLRLWLYKGEAIRMDACCGQKHIKIAF